MENLADGRASYAHLNGQAEFGGHHQTMQSLRRKLYVDEEHQLTETGRQALEALRD